jgi:RNA 3'-terminal phosphate cyclase
LHLFIFVKAAGSGVVLISESEKSCRVVLVLGARRKSDTNVARLFVTGLLRLLREAQFAEIESDLESLPMEFSL